MSFDIALLEPDDGERWLSTKEAAQRLAIVPRTLYRMIDSGQLPAYRFGRVIRILAVDIDNYITASRIEPGTITHLYDFPATDRHGEGSTD